MARWSSVMIKSTWWFSVGAAGLLQQCQWCWWSGATLPGRVTAMARLQVLWSRNDQIYSLLMERQQTAARLWHWLTLTHTSLNSGGQIVSALILSNVCLSFFWAAHEKFSDIAAMPGVTSHHIFLLLWSRPLQDVKNGDTTQPWMYLRQRPF